MNRNNIKPIYIILTIVIIFIVSIVSFNIYQTAYRADKIEISINTVPKDAKITLNGNTYGNGSNYIKSGEYNIIISKDGFKTVEKTDSFTKTGDEINIGLVAESKEAIAWAKANHSQYSDLENIIDQKITADGEKAVSANPIVKDLPCNNYLFKIGYKYNEDESIIITIDSSQQYRQSAISKIESLGYNLADYNYEYINFNNPFKL